MRETKLDAGGDHGRPLRDDALSGSWLGRCAGAWVTAVARRPRLVLALVGVLGLAALAGASLLRINTDTTRMLSPELAFQRRLDTLDAAFPTDARTLAIVVRAGEADAADAAAASLVRALTAEPALFPEVFAPAVDPWMVAHGLLYLDPETLGARLSRLSGASNLIARLRGDQTLDGFLSALDAATRLAQGAERAGGGGAGGGLDPLYAEAARVLAADRQGAVRPLAWSAALSGEAPRPVLRVVTVKPQLDYATIDPAGAARTAISNAVAALDPAIADGVDVAVTGDLALQGDEMESATGTLGLSLGMSLLLVAGLLRIGLGSVGRAGLALCALLVTLVLTAGLAGIAVGTLNLVSMAFVVLMVGLGIDYAIHFLLHFDTHGAAAYDATARQAALAAAARGLGPALGLSALTTALAFLAFATTDFIGMGQLGLIGGGGVLIALVVTLTVIPAAVSLWPRLARGPASHRLARPPAALRRLALPAALAVGVAGIALLPWSRFDADPMSLRDPAAPSVAAYRWLAADPELTPLTLNLIVPDAAAAREAAARLDPLPEVAGTTWVGDFVPKEQAD